MLIRYIVIFTFNNLLVLFNKNFSLSRLPELLKQFNFNFFKYFLCSFVHQNYNFFRSLATIYLLLYFEIATFCFCQFDFGKYNFIIKITIKKIY